jgi:hypothetical protein
MARNRNTRSTTIYWLVDVRPQTLIDRPNGKPFYCGKTVMSPARRLRDHRVAARKWPKRAISEVLLSCGEHLRIDIVEVVPAEPIDLWCERERFWISEIRRLYPDSLNTSDGGTGVPGMVHSREAIAKISATKTGTKLSPEHRAKIGESNRGKKRSVETRAKIGASKRENQYFRGRKHSDEARTKIGAASKARKRKAGAIVGGYKHSDEVRAKLSAAAKGRTFSAETRAKLSAAVRAYHSNRNHGETTKCH